MGKFDCDYVFMPRDLIAVFGGTFDPFHLGHKSMLEGILSCLQPDKLLLIPCAEPAHRDTPVVNAEHRLGMVRQATCNYRQVTVDDCELRRANKSFTIDTLEYLRATYGDTPTLVCCVGADAFRGMGRWHRAADLLNFAHIAVLPRDNEVVVSSVMPELPDCFHVAPIVAPQELKMSPFGSIAYLDIPLYPVSSTSVREEIEKQQGESLHAVLQGMLPLEVIAYIDEHRLYR